MSLCLSLCLSVCPFVSVAKTEHSAHPELPSNTKVKVKDFFQRLVCGLLTFQFHTHTGLHDNTNHVQTGAVWCWKFDYMHTGWGLVLKIHAGYGVVLKHQLETYRAWICSWKGNPHAPLFTYTRENCFMCVLWMITLQQHQPPTKTCDLWPHWLHDVTPMMHRWCHPSSLFRDGFVNEAVLSFMIK